MASPYPNPAVVAAISARVTEWQNEQQTKKRQALKLKKAIEQNQQRKNKKR